jgi:hypothetical protein
VAAGAGGVAAEDGDADEEGPEVTASGAARVEAQGPVQLEGVCAEGFAEGDVHGESGEGEGGVWSVPGTVGAAGDGEGGPGGFGEGERELPGAGLEVGLGGEMESETKIDLEGGDDRGHGGGAGDRRAVGCGGGAALRGGEREREEFGAPGGGELAEEAGCRATWKPGDAAGPDGAAFESSVDHGALEPMGGVGGLDAGEGVVGAGEKKGAGLEASEAGVGDLVRDGLPGGVREVGSEGLGENVCLESAEGVGGAEVGAVGEVGSLDAVMVDEQDRAHAEEAEEASGFGAECAAADDSDGEGGDVAAGVGGQLKAAVVGRFVRVRHKRGGEDKRVWPVHLQHVWGPQLEQVWVNESHTSVTN